MAENIRASPRESHGPGLGHAEHAWFCSLAAHFSSTSICFPGDIKPVSLVLGELCWHPIPKGHSSALPTRGCTAGQVFSDFCGLFKEIII